jgi:hypothetical protein
MTKEREALKLAQDKELKELLDSLDFARRSKILREESYIRMDPVTKPRTFNHIVDGQVYIPEKHVVVRPGANDHQRYKSRGV